MVREAARPDRLLLHICCAPCAAYPVPALRAIVPLVAGYFSNPNIQPLEEHRRRRDALEQYAPVLGLDVVFAEAPGPGDWATATRETGEGRCRACYELRLRATARAVRRLGCDAFSTTLLYSVHQKHEVVRAVAAEVARSEGVAFLYRDLREGWEDGGRRYRESGLYRQRYCGCQSSARERDERRHGARTQGV